MTFAYFLFFPTLFVLPAAAWAAPSITNVVPNAGNPGRYEKFEVTFDVGNTAADNFYWPYDALPPSGVPAGTGITVNGVFTGPDGVSHVQPGFYYQEFEDDVRSGDAWLYPTGKFAWKIRFSPHLAGGWSYRIDVQDVGGSAQYSGGFTAGPSGKQGFVRVSPNDPRYFEHDDGAYFPALGYNLNYRGVDWINPQVNESHFALLRQNSIQLFRIWLSQWNIFGTTWNPWVSFNSRHNTQEPSDRISHPGDARLAGYGFTPPAAATGSDAYLWLNFDTGQSLWQFTPCMAFGPNAAQVPLKPATPYRLRVRYQTRALTGALVSGKPSGLAVKTGGWMWNNAVAETAPAACVDCCYSPDTGTVRAASYDRPGDSWSRAPDPQNPGWEIMTGTFTAGPAENFTGYLYLALENVAGGHAFVDHVWLEEDKGGGQFGPNVVYKPWMDHHKYINQRSAYAFDKTLAMAEAHDVYLKTVVMEKNDGLLNFIGPDGDFASQRADGNTNFYGDFRNVTKGRWLQTAWWRYLQARWGYSPNIHSWELLNEGDPGSQRHFALADELGKYMRCGAFGVPTVFDPDAGDVCRYDHPNSHLVTTSFWNGFPWGFWSNQSKLYADVSYADQHLYIVPGSTYFNDDAMAHVSLSMQRGSYKGPDGALNPASPGKPVMRGEVAWTWNVDSAVDDAFDVGTNGVWLHNFLWSGLNAGGVIESYWNGGGGMKHIYNIDRFGNVHHDHRPVFKTFHNFISRIPLNNGFYRDAEPAAAPGLRAWGQKDLTNQRMHLWIQNAGNTWKNVYDGVPVPPVSGPVSAAGFQPGADYRLEWWNTREDNPPYRVETITADAAGTLTIPISALAADVAVTVSPDAVDNIPPSPPGGLKRK